MTKDSAFFMNLIPTIGSLPSNLSHIKTKEFMNVKLHQIQKHHSNTFWELSVSVFISLCLFCSILFNELFEIYIVSKCYGWICKKIIISYRIYVKNVSCLISGSVSLLRQLYMQETKPKIKQIYVFEILLQFLWGCAEVNLFFKPSI